MRYIFIVCFATLLFGCKSNADQLKSLQAELEETKSQLTTLQNEIDASRSTKERQLVHIVFLKLKEDLSEEDRNTVIEGIKKMKEINVLSDLEVGKIADTGDPRFISDHDIVFQMDLASMAEMETYQKAPLHLELKEMLGPFLAGPPAVFDYWTL